MRRRSASSAICWKSTGLGGEMLETVNLHLEGKGVRITTGTIVDATIIHGASSTKNREQKRGPESAPDPEGEAEVLRDEGTRWCGQQAKLIQHGGSDASQRRRCHGAAGVIDGEERKVWGDQAYRGQGRGDSAKCAPLAQDCTQRRIGIKTRSTKWSGPKNRTKSRVRSKSVRAVFWSDEIEVRLPRRCATEDW